VRINLDVRNWERAEASVIKAASSSGIDIGSHVHPARGQVCVRVRIYENVAEKAAAVETGVSTLQTRIDDLGRSVGSERSTRCQSANFCRAILANS